MYGMLDHPWVSEKELARALAYREGRELPDGHPCQPIVEHLNAWEVTDHERKHPQFSANVSLRSLLFQSLANIGMSSFCLGFEKFGAK